jgi:hypothetical protein
MHVSTVCPIPPPVLDRELWNAYMPPCEQGLHEAGPEESIAQWTAD